MYIQGKKLKATKRYSKPGFIAIAVKGNGREFARIENASQDQVSEFCAQFKHTTRVKVAFHMPKRHTHPEVNILMTTWYADDQQFVMDI